MADGETQELALLKAKLEYIKANFPGLKKAEEIKEFLQIYVRWYTKSGIRGEKDKELYNNLYYLLNQAFDEVDKESTHERKIERVDKSLDEVREAIDQDIISSTLEQTDKDLSEFVSELERYKEKDKPTHMRKLLAKILAIHHKDLLEMSQDEIKKMHNKGHSELVEIANFIKTKDPNRGNEFWELIKKKPLPSIYNLIDEELKRLGKPEKEKNMIEIETKAENTQKLISEMDQVLASDRNNPGVKVNKVLGVMGKYRSYFMETKILKGVTEDEFSDLDVSWFVNRDGLENAQNRLENAEEADRTDPGNPLKKVELRDAKNGVNATLTDFEFLWTRGIKPFLQRKETK